MKSLFFTQCFFLLGFSTAFAQGWTSLYSEDFEAAGHSFSLNTTDASSSQGLVNTWVVNNAYTGGSFPVTCALIGTTTVTSGNTTDQPMSFANAPQSSYLHTLSTAAQAGGVLNNTLQGADGFCALAENTFSAMSAGIDTRGLDSVELSFWWHCQGGSAIYGELYYSTNGGASWTHYNATRYNLQTTWQFAQLRDDIWAGHSDLRFGFRFVNGIGTGASSPGFAVDEIELMGLQANSISLNSISVDSFCSSGGSFDLDFSVSGSFDPSNMFYVEHSDATGAFSMGLGLLDSFAVAGTYTLSLPNTIVEGNAYRIRVRSSNLATSSAALAFVVESPAQGGTVLALPQDLCPGATGDLELIGAAGTVVDWEQSPGLGINFSSLAVQGTSIQIGPLFDNGYYRALVERNNACGTTNAYSDTVYIRAGARATINYTRNDTMFLGTFFSSSLDADTCLWIIDGTSYGPVPCDSVVGHSFGGAGNYTVELQSSIAGLPCADTTNTELDFFPVSLRHIASSSGLKLYPNPYSSGQLFVELEVEASDYLGYRLYDARGALLYAAKAWPVGRRYALELPSNLAAALYFLQLEAGDGSILQSRVLDIR